MGFTNNPAYRLLQVFLGQSADAAQVFEVYVDRARDRLVCTCPGWKLRHGCKHAAYVAEQIEERGGYFAPVMRENAVLTEAVMQDPVAFRQWIYSNANVLMLE